MLAWLKLILPVISLLLEFFKARFEKRKYIRREKEEALKRAKKALKDKDTSTLNAYINKLKQL